ncbi:MAG: AAA family ATPase, partial [Actinomycetaceae bacterium]|nr:AAA family ATPase [Actinomycetaceae bacterium]
MDKYRPRIVDSVLDFKLRSKGAVLIEGPKWCGKTTTASQVAKSVLLMQENAVQNRELAQVAPKRLLQGEVPRLIDEWQLAPELWDAVRVEVDKRDDFGQFILTGSAVPPSLEKIYHTGTGRITRMVMRPMTLFESGDSSGEVSLSALFDGQLEVDGENKAD